jgi:hypothetical protein
MNLARFAGTLLLALSIPACAAQSSDAPEATHDALTASAPITLGNWLGHPKIVEIRRIAEGVESGIAAGTLTKQERDFPNCDNGDIHRAKFTDEHGVIRKLVMVYGGEDGGGDITYVYDAAGKPRFYFQRNESQAAAQPKPDITEFRVYVDVEGQKFWQVMREGVGDAINTAPFSIPDSSIGWDPGEPSSWNASQLFDGPPQCG